MIKFNNILKRNVDTTLSIIVICGMFALVFYMLTMNIGSMFYLIPVMAQSEGNMQITNENVKSIPHDVKGHENHQVVKFLDEGLEANLHVGVVSFNSSKPVDIISYTDITGDNSSSNMNSTKKIWYTEFKQFEPKTLLKNVSTGTVDFNSNGILAHRALNDTFFVNFTLSNQMR